MHVMADSILSDADDPETNGYSTVLMGYALSTLVSAILFVAVGHASAIAHLTKCIPTHILTGICGGIGLFVVTGSVEMATGPARGSRALLTSLAQGGVGDPPN